jgi:hypothetical protein
MSSTAIGSRASGVRWRWARRVEAILFNPPSAAAAAGLTLAIMFGCGTTTHNHITTVTDPPGVSKPTAPLDPSGPKTQIGEVSVPGHGEQVVYYPTPFASPPNLVLGDLSSHCELLEQKADCFRVKNTSVFSSTINWKACGMTYLLTPATVVPAVEPATLSLPAPVKLSAPDGVPPLPVPYEAQSK